MNELGHRVYKRLETDAEFIARIEKHLNGWMPQYEGEHLDLVVWTYYKLQRRIVEDTTDPADKR